ncbi:uncharacterized protein LOC134813476 [Bolinopsis microptera]|uniref:uncharacterized protein LOC134813476 n=1 Tax=Bolinopsis microptera TaxID=2820187 RepID=UPI003079D7FC
MPLETILEGEALRSSLSLGDAALPLYVMVNDFQNGRCWIPHIEKDTYCRSLRRRLRREVASLDKVRTVKYYQFPQRPITRGALNVTPVEDEDQTDVFMFRTNTRLSFKPFVNSGSQRHSRHGDHHPTGKPYYNYKETQEKVCKQQSKVQRLDLMGSPVVDQNYQSFRPGNYLTVNRRLRGKPSRYSMTSQSSYNHLQHIQHMNSLY